MNAMTGTLILVAETPRQIEVVAQRVIDWAGDDAKHVLTTSQFGSSMSVVIPETILYSHGPLFLKRGGPDLVSVNDPGVRSIVTVANGDALSRDPQHDLADQITLSFTKDNGTVYTLDYENSPGHGPVRIFWGDGWFGNPFFDEGPEAGRLSHRYAWANVYPLRIQSLDGFAETETWVKITS